MAFKLEAKHTQALEELESTYHLTYVTADAKPPEGVACPYIRCDVIDRPTGRRYASGYSVQVGPEGEKEATINAINAARRSDKPKRPHEVISEQAARIAELEAQLAAASKPAAPEPDPEIEALRAEYLEVAGDAPDKRWGAKKLTEMIEASKSA